MASADGEYKCSVGGLALTTTDQTLQDAFSQFGDIVEAKVVTDKDTGRSRGFGMVTFKDEKALQDAIEGMTGKKIDGREVIVNANVVRSSKGGGFRSGGGGGRYGGGDEQGGSRYSRRGGN